MEFEYIKNYYNVPAEIGRDVTVSNRLGTISKDLGHYIGVIFHDDKDKKTLPCHPTSEVVYLDSFTESKKLRPKVKNWRSKSRYQDYLSACEWYDGTFKDYLMEEKLIKSGKYFD